MNTIEARELLDLLTGEQEDTLENAWLRYMFLVGAARGGDDDETQARQDRIAFAHLLPERSEGGLPVIEFPLQAAFMAAVSGLPETWCLAWCLCDFQRTEGISYEAAMEIQREQSAEKEADHVVHQ